MNTEFFSQINWLAVLVASLAYFMIGAIWYSKAVFGSKWAALVKLDMSDPNLKKGMGKMMAATFFLVLLTTFGLALFIVKINFGVNLLYGIEIGLLTGICYASTAVSINYVYENKPFSLYLINNGYHVVGHVLAATILIMWR
jgi:hypothetical protein